MTTIGWILVIVGSLLVGHLVLCLICACVLSSPGSRDERRWRER